MISRNARFAVVIFLLHRLMQILWLSPSEGAVQEEYA